MAESEELDLLAEQERTLLARLPYRSSTSDEVEQAAIASDYTTIAFRYLALARAGDVEATKRVLLLWWLSIIDPAVVTGLPDFDDSFADDTVALLRREVQNPADIEMRAMIAWLYAIGDWLLDARAPDLSGDLASTVLEFLDEDGRVDFHHLDLERYRGQWTEYFQSLASIPRGELDYVTIPAVPTPWFQRLFEGRQFEIYFLTLLVVVGGVTLLAESCG